MDGTLTAHTQVCRVNLGCPGDLFRNDHADVGTCGDK